MRKTTAHLLGAQKNDLERPVTNVGGSQATPVSATVERGPAAARPPRPQLPLFASKDRTLAEKVDEALDGFGAK
jgi:hypothetical protein